MKILVIGAHGRTGAHVMKYRDIELIPFEGDILDEEVVDLSVSRVDAVVSVVGHVKGSAPDFQTRGMKNIVISMKTHGVRRIVSLTGTGVRLPGDKITMIDRLLNFSIKIIDPARVSDGQSHAELLQSSDLDWTIIRVLKLTNGTQTNKWQLLSHGPTKTLISRADVASAIEQVLSNNSFIREMPIISKL